MKKQICASVLVMVLHCAALAQASKQNHLVITGKVFDEQGQPVSGAVVTAYRDRGISGRPPSAQSNERGEFKLVVSQTGSYMIAASKPAEGYPSSRNPLYYPSEDSLARVFVNEDEATPFVIVRMGEKAGRLAGRAVDAETGQPVEKLQITICRAETPKYCYRFPFNNKAGLFNVFVPSSPFTAQVSADGYKDWFGAERAEKPAVLQVDSGATQVISVSLEKLPADDKALNPSMLEAPKPLSPLNRAEFDHAPRMTKLEWSAVPGAASYTVELEICMPVGADGKECEGTMLFQMRGNPPLSGIQGTSYHFHFVGAQPGRWRVWAVDAEGRLGMKSNWSLFFYKR